MSYDANIARILRMVEPLEQSKQEVAVKAIKAMRMAVDCLMRTTDRSLAIASTMQAANEAAAFAQEPKNSQWLIAEQSSRGAMCAFLTLTQQFDMARDVAAWSAHWTAADKAVKESKVSCTPYALEAWKLERSYGAY